MEGAREWAHEVHVRRVDVLGGDLGAPESMRFQGLGLTGFCERCVVPGYGAVAVQLGPVALLYMSLLFFGFWGGEGI